MTRSARGRYAWPPPVDAVGCIDVYRHGENVGGSDPYMTNGRWDDDPDLDWTWSGDVPDVDHIAVWPFDEAPGELRALSDNGGDEDWVALVPKAMAETYIPWLDHGSFGVCDISRYELPDGRAVFIGAHS